MGLLFREVTLTAGRPQAVTELTLITEFVSDRNALGAVCVIDLPLAAWIGAAIGLLPPGIAKESVDEKSLTSGLLENVGEVMSVLASVFNATGGSHVRRGDVHAPGSLPPAAVSQLARAAGGRCDFTVEVAGYGKGSFSLVVV